MEGKFNSVFLSIHYLYSLKCGKQNKTLKTLDKNTVIPKEKSIYS